MIKSNYTVADRFRTQLNHFKRKVILTSQTFKTSYLHKVLEKAFLFMINDQEKCERNERFTD